LGPISAKAGNSNVTGSGDTKFGSIIFENTINRTQTKEVQGHMKTSICPIWVFGEEFRAVFFTGVAR